MNANAFNFETLQHFLANGNAAGLSRRSSVARWTSARAHAIYALAYGVGEVSEFGCWEWKGERNFKGYGRVYIRGKQLRAHRLSFELSHGPVPPGLFVCHHCDNPPCINPAHLWAGTRSENMRDAWAKGRLNLPRCVSGHRFGFGNVPANAKLSDVALFVVRAAFARGAHPSVIATAFGVCDRTVRDVVRGRQRRTSQLNTCSHHAA